LREIHARSLIALRTELVRDAVPAFPGESPAPASVSLLRAAQGRGRALTCGGHRPESACASEWQEGPGCQADPGAGARGRILICGPTYAVKCGHGWRSGPRRRGHKMGRIA
jgi:hypothetical protein